MATRIYDAAALSDMSDKLRDRTAGEHWKGCVPPRGIAWTAAHGEVVVNEAWVKPHAVAVLRVTGRCDCGALIVGEEEL